MIRNVMLHRRDNTSPVMFAKPVVPEWTYQLSWGSGPDKVHRTHHPEFCSARRTPTYQRDYASKDRIYCFMKVSTISRRILASMVPASAAGGGMYRRLAGRVR